MDSASSTNMPLNTAMTHGFWNHAWMFCPSSAASTPATV